MDNTNDRAICVESTEIMSVKFIVHEAHDLNHQVHFVLSRDPYIGRRDVTYEVIDQDVFLSGCVTTYYQKQMAQESLRKIEGISRIVNQLSVVTG